MSCGACAKVIVFVTNVIFALASLALVGAGIAVLVVVKDENISGSGADGEGDTAAEAGPVAVIAVGAVAFVVSFFGCCGAIMDNKCMLFTYSILLIILMNLKTALATIILVAQTSIKDSLHMILQREFENNSGSFTEIEKLFSCCGTAGARSYDTITLPASCCNNLTNCTMLDAYSGCNAAVDAFVHDFGYGIAACCIILVFIELIAVIFGLCLANHVGNKYKGRY